MIYAAVIAILTFAAGLAYQRVWSRWRKDGVTPTGFGAALAPVMLGAALANDAAGPLVAALGIITGVTALYWIDDFTHLSARLRIVLSGLAGAAIGCCYLAPTGLGWPAVLGAAILAGCLCVVLANMVNFCDGADLNLASFIALTAILILIFAPGGSDWRAISLGMLGFILPFAVMNSRPRTIYLGDSGSFAFAGLLTAMAVAFFHGGAKLPPEAAIPAALPALDAAYVFAVRIIEKHDLLTRNYLHLYQRLNRRYRGFGYLLPQFVNVALCLGVAALLEAWGCDRIVAVIGAMVGLTVPFYFACRRVFLVGPSEGPLYETSR